MKIKEVTKFLVSEGKKLPKPVWVAVLVMPFGLEVLGVYLVGKAIMRKRK